MIADFERQGALEGWTVQATSGAHGVLSLGEGCAGTGAQLTYDLGVPGAAVAAQIVLDEPVTGAALDLWLRTPIDVYVTAWVSDVEGRAFEYALLRPFDVLDPERWFRKTVALDAPLETEQRAAATPLAVTAVAVVIHGVTAGTSGTVGFDEIALTELPVFSLQPFAASVPIGSGSLSDTVGSTRRLGCNVHVLHENIIERPEALDILRDAGYSLVRTDLEWAIAEPVPGNYDFSPWDPIVDMIESRGLGVLFILCYGHPVHTNGAPPVEPDELDAFLDFVEAAVRHFSGHSVAYEVWNEPNAPLFWPPDADPEEFAALCRTVADRVESIEPDATVCTGGITSHAYDYLESIVSMGAADRMGAIGVHPYMERPEHLALYLPWIRDIVAHSSVPGIPVWQTEWGYASTGPEGGHSAEARRRQGVLLARELLLCWAAGFPVVVTYELIDGGWDPRDPEQNYGLLTADLSQKPAINAVETLVSVAETRRIRGFLHTPLSGLHALRIDGCSETIVALWYGAPGGEAPVMIPPGGAAVDVLGHALSWPEAGGEVTVSEQDGPVYVSYRRPPRATSGRVGIP